MPERPYRPPPTVKQFLKSNAFVRYIVGPVGSGKSSGCIVEIIRRAGQQAPGSDGLRRTRFAVIRNTYRELRDTTRKTFEQWIPPHAGRWREQDFTFEVSFGDVRSEVLFRALDRPEDVKKVLSLELTGAYINEAREIPKSILDALQGRVGRYPSRAEGGATWFGIWGDTNPWHSSHWAAKLFKQRLEGFELYRQPSGRAADAENTENLPPGYYARLIAGKDSEWVKVYVDGEDASADVGSVYGSLIDKLEARGGVAEFDHPTDGVFTSWDLGFSDSTAIWFWRIGQHGVPDFIDHYEANGQPFSHFADEIDRRGFQYVKHWLPHDARAKTMASGSSVQELAMARWPSKVAITPGLSLADGIQAGRWLLEQRVRFHSRCAKGVEALRSYRYEWDEAARVFSRTPLHDWSSHTADAFRYAAVVAKHSELITRKQETPPAPRARNAAEFTLDELFEMHEAGRGPERI